jgi:hypothetical protein
MGIVKVDKMQTLVKQDSLLPRLATINPLNIITRILLTLPLLHQDNQLIKL